MSHPDIPKAPQGQQYKIEFIAGGVVKDQHGNIIDDSSEKAAQARMKALGIVNVLEEDNQ